MSCVNAATIPPLIGGRPWRCVAGHMNNPTEEIQLSGHTGAVRCLATLSNTAGDVLVVSGGNDKTLRIWSIVSGTVGLGLTFRLI